MKGRKPPHDDNLEARMLEEMRALESAPPFTLSLTPIEGWLIFAQLQLAFRHPANTGPARKIVERFARQLEAHVAVTPALKEMARRSWDRQYDEPDEVPL